MFHYAFLLCFICVSRCIFLIACFFLLPHIVQSPWVIVSALLCSQTVYVILHYVLLNGELNDDDEVEEDSQNVHIGSNDMQPFHKRDYGILFYWWRFGAVGSDVGRINEITLRRARLILGWVTVSGFNLTNHSGQLSLAIPLWVGAMSTGQRAVMLCDWEAKANMVLFAGNTV